MLLRLITVISLIKFMLLLISGMDMEVALYRSLIVFMILFTVVYMTIFFLNVIREKPEGEKPAVQGGNHSQTNKEEK
ncbi:MAG: hypothetical protein JJU46_13965 [Balneolaceae bacterium]|nr:hypothetical protein [Balneolaceae bacterium]MCH8547283.1 hypothetical protein [Balneolaceae bacterium]